MRKDRFKKGKQLASFFYAFRLAMEKILFIAIITILDNPLNVF